jgi:hypothetical protein
VPRRRRKPSSRARVKSQGAVRRGHGSLDRARRAVGQCQVRGRCYAGSEPLQGRLDCGRSAVVHGDRGTGREQSPRGREAEAARGPGDQRALALEVVCHRPSPGSG